MRIAIALLALALATGCKKKETKPAEPTGSAGSATAGSDQGSGSAMAGSDQAGSGSDVGSAAAGSGAGSDAPQQMLKRAGNCPSTVLGATTKVEVKGKTVVVTIIADDADAAMAIQKRSQELLEEKADKVSGGGHDQKGTHGGGAGLCPVYVPEGATAAYKAVTAKPAGAAITITPKDKPEDLKTAIDARIAKASEWVKTNIKPGDKGNQGGVGGGKGDHGANHSGEGDSKGVERKGSGAGGGKDDGGGGGKGTGGGGSKGTGGGGGTGSAKK
jgi:hypothetical protein